MGNRADSGNESGRLDVPNRRDGEQDLPLAAIGHDSADLCLQEGQVFLNQPQFFEKEGLFEEESLQPVNIFGAYRLAGKLLELEELCIRGKVSRSECSQSREAGRSKCRGSGKLLSKGECGGQIWVAEYLGEFRKELVADRSQFVFQLRPVMTEFVAMLDEAFQLSGCLRWRNGLSNELHVVGHLNAQFKLRLERVCQVKCITLVRFHHPFRPLLNMDAVDGDIHLQEILLA